MVFYFNANGELLKTIPEPIFQGSNKASKLLVVAPISANAVLNVSFKLPNGYVTTQMPMTNQGQLAEITAPSNALLNVWSIDLPLSVTAYAGVVNVQFFVTVDDQLIATQSTNFNVNKGVPVMLPSAPKENVYADILAYLQTLTEAVYSNTQGTNGLLYSRTSSAASVRGYSGTSANVVIPEWYIHNGEYYPVTKIENGAFSNSTGLIESVIIPESVTIIDGAFTNLIKLKEIEIPASVTSAQNAFTASKKLGKIIFRGDVPGVSAETFYQTGTESVDGVCRVFVPIEYYDNYVEKFKPYNSVWSQVKLISYVTTEDVKELEEKIATEKTERKSEVSRVEGQISAVADKVTGIESEISPLVSRLQTVETKLPTLESEIEEANNQITAEAQARAKQDEEIGKLINELNANLLNYYYKKTDTYSRAQIDSLVSQLSGGGLTLEKYDALPTTGNSKVIYLIPVAGTNGNVFDEYIWFEGKWEKIGSTSVNLTNYFTKLETETLINDLLASYYTKEEADNLLAEKANNADLAAVAKSGKYEDLTGKPTSLKNPNALTFGSKTYDGSAAATVTKADLGLGNVPNVNPQNAANLTSGIVPDARLSENIARASALLKKLDVAPETAPVGSVPTKTANGIEWKEVEGGGGGLTVIEKTFTATDNDNEFIATFTEEEFAQLGVNTLISAAGSSDMPIIVRYAGGNDFIKMYGLSSAEVLTIMSPLMSPTDNAYLIRAEIPIIGGDNTFTGSNDFTGGLTKNGVEVATLDDVANAGGGGGGSVTVDSEFSETSTNPVQNKVVTEEFGKKVTLPEPVLAPIATGDAYETLIFDTSKNIDEWLKGLQYQDGGCLVMNLQTIYGATPFILAGNFGENVYIILNALTYEGIYSTEDFAIEGIGSFTKGWAITELNVKEFLESNEQINSDMVTFPLIADVTVEQDFILTEKNSGLLNYEDGNCTFLSKSDLIKEIQPLEIEFYWNGEDSAYIYITDETWGTLRTKQAILYLRTETNKYKLTPKILMDEGIVAYNAYYEVVETNPYGNGTEQMFIQVAFGVDNGAPYLRVYKYSGAKTLYQHNVRIKVVWRANNATNDVTLEFTLYNSSPTAFTDITTVLNNYIPNINEYVNVGGSYSLTDTGISVYPILDLFKDSTGVLKINVSKNGTPLIVDISSYLSTGTITDKVTEV